MRECAVLAFNGTSLDYYKETNEKLYYKMLDASRFLNCFALYAWAHSLGIRFGPHDLDIEMVNMLAVIKEEAEKREMRKLD
jgi:hypothetical protein